MSTSSLSTGELQMEALERVAARLLNSRVISIKPIGGGRNSQVYRLIGVDSQVYALKAYFRHASDNRDRLRTEFSSLCFLWENGIRDIPRPLVADWEQGCALYEYIDGQKIATDAITDAEIDTAALFLVHLKDLRGRAESSDFAPAAEACFSVQAIVQNIRQRLSRLMGHRTDREDYAELHEFLDHHLTLRLREIIRWCQANLELAHLSYDVDLEMTGRTLSPSDFGFHNALKRSSGQLVFLDFEYFGWDDPAKMTVDVLLHPGMNLAESLKRRFVHGILEGFADNPCLAKRVEIVYPLFGLKWCLILLNEFLPEHLIRRQFAGAGNRDPYTVRMEQLAKAQSMLQKVEENYEHFLYFE